MHKYNFDTNTWTNIVRIPNIQTIIMEFTMVYSYDQVFIIGGIDIERRISNRAMIFTEEFGLDSCLPMAFARCRPAVAHLDGIIYVVGGQGDSCTLASAEAYDISSEQWRHLPDSPNARASACACAVVTKNIYVLGGGSEEYDFILHIDVYEIKYEGWNTLYLKTRAGLINAVAYPIPHCNGILLIGGFVSENESKAMQLLNLNNMTWTDWHELPIPVSDHWNLPVIFDNEKQFLHIFNANSHSSVQHVYYNVVDILEAFPKIETRSFKYEAPQEPLSNIKLSRRIGNYES